MKRIHIISTVLIVGAIALLISASGDMSTYSSFAHARGDSGKKVKIAGQLAKDKDMVYNPDKDPNHFSFYLSDDMGDVQQVVLLAPKPQDFELSEQVVATGYWNEDHFVATSILLKCPSKYKNEEVFLKG